MKKLAFFSLFALSALLGTAQVQKVKADGIIGVVGDRIILQSDIKNAVDDASRQGQQLPANAACTILEQALISKVLMLQAMKDSLPVTDEEVEAELDQRVRYFIQQYGTQEEVERLAGKTIYQIKDDARESVKERKLAESMQRKIVDGIRITPTEVRAYFDRIPKDSLPFFETELEIGQIVLYPKASRDMEKYVIDEMNNYKRQIEMKVATFEQLVRQFSEDPGSKDRGGQYELNRNEKSWDPAFMSAAFRLKNGELSPVFKSKFGYHIIQMVQRSGDNAIVRHILRRVPVTDAEINDGIARLDSVRSKIVAGTMDFGTAAGKYSDDEAAKFSGPYITSRDGDTYNTIDELDKEIVAALDKLKVGDISQPMAFVNERGDKGVRVLYLKSRSEPHRMNVRDDYNKIAQAALEEKKYLALEKWLNTNIPTYYIHVDESVGTCEGLKKWMPAEATAGME
ncbi:MAG TPA: peptidylprolyl isomerase [Chitinophagaceae bacterium]|jgi:peptidyl-prolyl cis-trans isomerase SurA|nr:peptidylprolyl isomerase [Chitinophagaceae bacterium]